MGAYKDNGEHIDPICIDLSDYSVEDLLPSIRIGQAAAIFRMADQNRTDEEKRHNKYRGMFCEDWFIHTNPFGFFRNKTSDKLAPEIGHSNGGLWDAKSILKGPPPQDQFNLFVPTANFIKDKRLQPPLTGYIGMVMQHPPSLNRQAFTIKVFEEERFEILREARIYVIGWITLSYFDSKKFSVPEGQDLNQGTGPYVKACKDNVGVYLRDLTPFKAGRGVKWPYKTS